MESYISKSALVAEIESKKKRAQILGDNAINSSMQQFFDGMKQGCVDILSFLDTLEVKEVEEEPVSNDLEEAASQYPSIICQISPQWTSEVEKAFKAGAEWQKEQMEKNRIAHCDNITEEQYNLETGFLDDFLDKNKRMPTFLDAIEYGIQKAQKGK